MQVVGETDECVEAIHLAAQHSPDIILLDIEFNECDGAALTRMIKRQLPDVFVVVLTADIKLGIFSSVVCWPGQRGICVRISLPMSYLPGCVDLCAVRQRFRFRRCLR